MKPAPFVVALTGPFAGQIGRVVSRHTYPEIGPHLSVRFAAGGLWIAATAVRPATAAEIASARPALPLRPAA